MFSSFQYRDHPAGFRISDGGAGPVGAKPNDHLAISDSAKPAGLTSNVVPDLGRGAVGRPARLHDQGPARGAVWRGDRRGGASGQDEEPVQRQRPGGQARPVDEG